MVGKLDGTRMSIRVREGKRDINIRPLQQVSVILRTMPETQVRA